MNKDKSKIFLIAIGVPLLVGFAYFGVVRPILRKLNIVDTKEEKKGLKSLLKISTKQVLSPQFYIENKNKVTISSSIANTLATQVYEGKYGGCGGFCDDETKGVGAITSAGSKVNISYIAYQFNILYGASMESYLETYLEPENWITIENYISKI